MASQKELDDCYMKVARAHALLSKANRLQVGACIVTLSGVILGGCNGLPRVLGNSLESCEESPEGPKYTTKPEVIHAEENCILKAAKEGVSIIGATAYLTHSPCQHCASMLLSVGIARVVYEVPYRLSHGIDLLKNNLVVEQWS